MKKKILSFVMALLLIVPVCFMLAGCGAQFIEERKYQLLGMIVIRDNTPGNGMYVQYEDGEYATSLTGSMVFEKCTIEVGRETSYLIFDDTEETGIKATYSFNAYTDESVYPAFSLDSYAVTLNGQDAKNLSEDQIAELDAEVLDVYQDIIQFGFICEQSDMSIQLITQNQSFACHIIIKDKTNGDLWFMGQVYGY